VATPVQEKHASGTGKVVTVDEVKGKVRIAHLPLPDANWPGMTTTFDAKPELLSGIAPGQTVSFDVTFRGGSGEVTAIRR
jgi:Cu/Ag efflux protein CusF